MKENQEEGSRAIDPPHFVAEFEVAWKHYPRKDARKAALRAYTARRRAGISAEDLLKATENYAAGCAAAGTERRFVKHGATFYGPDDHWQDWLSPPDDEAAERERLAADYEANVPEHLRVTR